MKRFDFSAWNLVYMVTYFFNVVYIGSSLADHSPQIVFMPIFYFQAIIFTLLLFSKRVISALLSIAIPAIAFIPWSIIVGTFDPAQAYFMPLGLILIVVMAGILRSMILNHLHEKFLAQTEQEKAGFDTPHRLIAVDVCMPVVSILFVAGISLGFTTSPNLFSWLISLLAIVPAFLVVLDIVFHVHPKERLSIYHPILTHHFIEESNHTFGATYGWITIFFCTRCTGMLIGLFLSMYGFVVFKITLPPLVALVVDCFLPVPIFIDWGTQRLGFRESTTRSRVVTGAIVGLGFALVPQSSPEYAFASGILLMIYFAIFILLFVVGTRRAPGFNDEEADLVPEDSTP
ncbi:MAG TPA: DUF2085 domain-containing protein [Candidatus Lokiarchaeia archaeon]|nr:DUF2085 domain-containing protein [Candidatus Lokiarchaeia archaeon]